LEFCLRCHGSASGCGGRCPPQTLQGPAKELPLGLLTLGAPVSCLPSRFRKDASAHSKSEVLALSNKRFTLFKVAFRSSTMAWPNQKSNLNQIACAHHDFQTFA